MEEPGLTLPDPKFYSIISTSFYDKFIAYVKRFSSIYFFSLNEIRCTDQIGEAYRRSKNISNCKINERGAYFLCLLTGTPRIDVAIEQSGLKKGTEIFGSISEYPSEIEHFEDSFKGLIAPAQVNLKKRCSGEDMKIFTYMTMADFRLHTA